MKLKGKGENRVNCLKISIVNYYLEILQILNCFYIYWGYGILIGLSFFF